MFMKYLMMVLSFSGPLLAQAQTCNPYNISATTPTSRFIDNDNGTVTDTYTGLMWKKCSEGQNPLTCIGTATSVTWQIALLRAQAVNNGTIGSNLGYTDWRVPNIKELDSLVEQQCYAPSINLAVFPNTPSSTVWSSSYSSYDVAANALYFDRGTESRYYTTDNMNVRLVRGGL